MRSLMIRMVVMLWGTTLFGCGWDAGEISPRSTERVFQDGRVYILYNMKPVTSYGARTFYIIFDGQRFDPLPNITEDGKPTLAGAYLITPDPLPGGTKVDFEYWTDEGIATAQKHILSEDLGAPVIIDGDVTIEFYKLDWPNIDGIVFPRVLSGKQDGPHIYE